MHGNSNLVYAQKLQCWGSFALYTGGGNEDPHTLNRWALDSGGGNEDPQTLTRWALDTGGGNEDPQTLTRWALDTGGGNEDTRIRHWLGEHYNYRCHFHLNMYSIHVINISTSYLLWQEWCFVCW